MAKVLSAGVDSLAAATPSVASDAGADAAKPNGSARDSGRVLSRDMKRKYALKRLHNDLREVLLNPLPTVSAGPVDESDFFLWHGNIKGPEGTPYEGVVFHLHITFPHDYPEGAPRVDLCTQLRHSSVYGRWICLDMLEADWCPDGSYTKNGKPAHWSTPGAVWVSQHKADVGTGWSSGYSALSVLLQLQAFLFSAGGRGTGVEWYHSQVGVSSEPEHVAAATREARDYRCAQCGHCADVPVPAFAPVGAACGASGVPLDALEARLSVLQDELRSLHTDLNSDGAGAGGDTAARASTDTDETGMEAVHGDSDNGREQLRAPDTRPQTSPQHTAATELPLPTQNADRTGAPTVDLCPCTEHVGHMVRAAPFGVFVDVGGQRLGLVHASQIRAGEFVRAEDEWQAAPWVEGECGEGLDFAPVQLQHGRPVRVWVKAGGAGGKLALTMVRPLQRVGLGALAAAAAAAGNGGNGGGGGGGGDNGGLVVLAGRVERLGNDVGCFVDIGCFRDGGQDGGGGDGARRQGRGSSVSGLISPECVRAAVYHQAQAQGERAPFFWHIKELLPIDSRILVRVTSVDAARGRVALELLEWSTPSQALQQAAAAESARQQEQEAAAAAAAAATAAAAAVRREGCHGLASFTGIGRLQTHTLRAAFGYLLPPGDSAPSNSPGAALAITRDARAFSCTSRAFDEAGAAAAASLLRTRQELRCFHSKADLGEDVLGVGVNLEHYPRRGGDAEGSAKVAYAHSSMDLVGYCSFHHEKLRRDVYKQPFSHWMPLYLDEAHGERALPLAEEAIALALDPSWALVSAARAATSAPLPFRPEMVLELLPKLMNSMVVGVMKGDVHASTACLEGYTAFLHLLLAFAERYPQLAAAADAKLAAFAPGGSSRRRGKRDVPSLGELLPLLAMSSRYRWEDVAHALLLEAFDRNAKWALAAFPELVDVSSAVLGGNLVEPQRLSKAFIAGRVSLHLLLFHHTFLELFLSGAGAGAPASTATRAATTTPEGAKRWLDEQCGRPCPAVHIALQARVKRIRRVDTWGGFFRMLRLPEPDAAFLSHWLRMSVINSGRRRYHDQDSLRRAVQEMADAKLAAKVESKQRRREARREAKDAEQEHMGDYEEYAARM